MKTCLRFLLLISLPVFLHAQAANRASQKATVSSLLPTNGTGSITAANLRTVVNSVIDSAYNPLDDGAPLSSSRTISTTLPLSGGGDLSANRTLSIADAAADGSTKGAAAFVAADFDATSGLVSLDYANGQKATGSVPGFLSAADWTTFNGKQAAGNYITGLSGDASASGPGSASVTVTRVNGVAFSGLGTGIVKNTTGTGVPSIAVAGTDYAPATSGSAILKGNGAGGFASAASGTDYAPATSGSAVLKGNGSGGFSAAVAGTDYLAPNGSGAGLSGVALSSVHPNTAPAAGQVMVGNAGGTAYAPVTVSGDVTISSSGVTAIGAAKVTNSMLAGSIDASTKLANATPIANGGTGSTTVGAANQALTPASVVLTPSAGAVTINWASSNAFDITLNANLSTVTFSNAADGQTIVVAITNTASNYTVTWGNSIKWPGGTQPTQTTGAKTDVWTITKHGSTYYGNVVQNF